MTNIAHPKEAFPLSPAGGTIPRSSEPPSSAATRPWILRFARTPDATQAIAVPPALYDPALQMSVSLYDGPLPFMETHIPTVPDGNMKKPPPLDEGPKD
ncbi:putative ATP-grasp-modified RiPP [Streptomyces lasiicapitis]|uniref:putative ATP-grasp-modified RiPP n=1 Tax=Streptomyces lasiicapitis TaxID=1923961 RepID=UPI0033296995